MPSYANLLLNSTEAGNLEMATFNSLLKNIKSLMFELFLDDLFAIIGTRSKRRT